MSQKYFKPVKKYVSRALAVEKLKLTPKQFDKLVVLCSIYPIQAPEKNCLDRVQGWYYTIDDIKKIYYSAAYDVVLKNEYNKKKRETYIKFNRLDKANSFKEEQYGLVDLVKSRYACLGDSLADFGTSIRSLYLIDMLKIVDINDVLQDFEAFILENRLLEKAFMARTGVFFSFNVESIRVVWSLPYPAQDFSEIIEEKKDIEKSIKLVAIDFLDFDSSAEDDGFEEEIIDPNDPDKLDITLLKYAAPLLATHLKLVVHKLKLLYGNSMLRRSGLFEGKKMHVAVKSIKRHTEFILRNEGAELVPIDDAEIVIAETVDEIRKGITYAQPQYVFDALNNGTAAESELYAIGRILPVHKSPFPDVLEALDSRVLKTLSNTKKYKILDKVVELN